MATTNITLNDSDYEIAKVRFLRNGQNIDQEFLLYVVKNKGVYIQQESRHKKLFLLQSVKENNVRVRNTTALTDQIIADTVLFPLSRNVLKE